MDEKFRKHMNSKANSYQLRFSQTASTNLYIIRILSSQMIAIGHIIEGLGHFELGNYIAGPILGFFFLMSGVLIAHNVFRRKKDEEYNFSQFFKRRYLRIYPNFVLVLLIILVLDALWLFLLGGQDLYQSYNIVAFLLSLVFLNDSALGVTSFGSARQLWALPPIWWLYMLFGWITLGKRQTKKKYLYYLLIGTFTFILGFIWLGFNTWIKIQFSLMWFLGAIFILVLNKFDTRIKNILPGEEVSEGNISESTRKKVVYLSLILTIGLVTAGLIRLYFHQNPFGIVYYFLIVGGILFLLVSSQYTRFKYPEKLRKGLKLIADYSLTLYLLHFSLANLLLGLVKSLNDVVAFFILFLISNAASLVVAYFTEMKSDVVYEYVQNKLNARKK